MILGVGIDLVDIERMARIHARFGDGLARRLLAQREHAAYASTRDAARFLAKRFAVKEATAKALGTGIAGGIRFTDVWVEHHESGAPCLCWDGFAQQRAERIGVARAHLSVSDERGQVMACVILEGD